MMLTKASPAPLLIVEDEYHMVVRLQRVLVHLGYGVGDWRVARCLEDAYAYLKAESFGLALVDIGLPDGMGLELVRHLSDAYPNVASLVITSCATDVIIMSALREGACGYVLKERDDLEIQLAINSVLHGGAPIDPFVARHLLALLGQGGGPGWAPGRRQPLEAGGGTLPLGLGSIQSIQIAQSTQAEEARPEILSPRETEVLRLVADGLTNREIADRLFLSPHTAACHIKNIYRKLAVTSRTKAMREARLRGLF